MWLAMFTAGFLWFYCAIWKWLVASDTKGIDLASLSVALLGIASIWFSRAFRDDMRTRVPLVSRFGLLGVGGTTLYALLTILVHRVTCTTSETGAPVCPAPLTMFFPRWALYTCAALMTAGVIGLIQRRISFQREYQQLQTAAVARYMS